MPRFWLVKSDPDTYSFHDLLTDGSTSWDGVRNYAARNFLREMKKGDKVLVYHSGGESCVIGLATVSKDPYTDPTADNDTWVSVELKAGKKLKKQVTLAQIKQEPFLKDISLIKISRLSVMPVSDEHYEKIMAMSQ
ncbi:MAG: EVE domain-containing protein [Bacteroidetes bacterium]|nr:MAG: EVE domain-containing protein [Bacteroidota bacterium]